MKISTKRCVPRQPSRVTAPYLRHYRKCRPFVPLIAMHKYIGKWSTFLFYSGSILIRTKGSSTKLIDTGESTLLCNISLLYSWATYYWWEEDVNVDIVDGQPIGTAWDRWNVAEPEMGVEGKDGGLRLIFWYLQLERSSFCAGICPYQSPTCQDSHSALPKSKPREGTK